MTKEEANREMAEYNEKTLMEVFEMRGKESEEQEIEREKRVNKMILEGFEITGKMAEEWRREDRKEKKIERMKAKGVYKNNTEYKFQYEREGKIDPIVGYRKKTSRDKKKTPLRLSQLSDKEKEDYEKWKKEEKRKKAEGIKI